MYEARYFRTEPAGRFEHDIRVKSRRPVRRGEGENRRQCRIEIGIDSNRGNTDDSALTKLVK